MDLKPFSRLTISWVDSMHFHIHHNGDSSQSKLVSEPKVLTQEFDTIPCRLLSVILDFATLLKCNSLTLFNSFFFNDLGSLYVFGVPLNRDTSVLLSNARKNLHKRFWLPGNQRFLSVQINCCFSITFRRNCDLLTCALQCFVQQIYNSVTAHCFCLKE